MRGCNGLYFYVPSILFYQNRWNLRQWLRDQNSGTVKRRYNKGERDKLISSYNKVSLFRRSFQHILLLPGVKNIFLST